MSAVSLWFQQMQSRIISSIQPSEGFISVSISSLIKTPNFASAGPIANPSGNVGISGSGAAMEHFVEVTEKGWKGKAAVSAADELGLGWNVKDSGAFARGMNAGQKSIPAMVGKEMGLLFEVEVFIYLVNTFKLKPIGQKDLAWASNESIRLGSVISAKIGVRLGKLVIEFIKAHSGGGKGMAPLIHSKAMALVRQCIVNSIEFTGGADGEAGASARLKEDTADLRIGCEDYLTGMRSSLGFSLKAGTETEVEVRKLGPGRALSILGASDAIIRQIKGIEDPAMKRQSLITAMNTAATKNYRNNPKKLASLLDLLVTGGSDTIPAYRSLLKPGMGPGFGSAIGRDFNTGEGPGRKISAKMGNSPIIDIISNATYVKINYKIQGGNHYGTSVIFEPESDGSKVFVRVTNLGSRNG